MSHNRYGNNPGDAIEIRPIDGGKFLVVLRSVGPIGIISPSDEPDGEDWRWQSHVIPRGLGGGREWCGFHVTQEAAADRIFEMYEDLSARGRWPGNIGHGGL